MTIPVPTEEVFLILKRYLPRGTYMSSAYRSPSDQLRVIQDLLNKYNADPKNKSGPISLPHNLSVDVPQSWLPSLIKLSRLLKNGLRRSSVFFPPLLSEAA
jgi:hypothetical protein